MVIMIKIEFIIVVLLSFILVNPIWIVVYLPGRLWLR